MLELIIICVQKRSATQLMMENLLWHWQDISQSGFWGFQNGFPSFQNVFIPNSCPMLSVVTSLGKFGDESKPSYCTIDRSSIMKALGR